MDTGGKGKMFNKTNLVLGLVQGFYWMASCLFISFMVRLLHGYGYDDYQIGITLTFASLASVIIQPLAGRIADRVGSVRTLLVAGLLSAVFGAIALDRLSHYTMAVYLLIPLIFGIFRSLIYIIDLWSLSIGRIYRNVSYGFTRSFGAVFYAVSAVFFGSFIDRYGTNIIIPFFCLFSATAVAMTLLIKTPKGTEKTLSRSESISIGKAVKLLLTNKAYIGLLISYTLVEMSCISHQNYLTRKFEVLGAGDFYTGLSLLVMGLLQLFPLLLNTRLTSRFSPSFLMMICLAGLNLRTLILAFSTTPIGTMCAFLTEPFAFGLYIGTILYYMNSILPETVRYLGMTMYAALTAGIGGMTGNFLAGFFSKTFGILPMMKYLAIPAMLGLIVYCVLYATHRSELSRKPRT
jgi:PPP family 3-phenylpropionic acid transporter